MCAMLFFTVMAPVGQTLAHSPHPMHPAAHISRHPLALLLREATDGTGSIGRNQLNQVVRTDADAFAAGATFIRDDLCPPVDQADRFILAGADTGAESCTP